MNRPLIANPLVWLRRFRHRRGYGVHSPFAFSFITGVVYEHTPYYAYAELSHHHPWWMRWFELHPVRCCRLLFRLANFCEAGSACLVGVGDIEYRYVRASRRCAHIKMCASCACVTPSDFVIIASAQAADAPSVVSMLPAEGMLVVEGIHDNPANLDAWHRVQADARTGVTFDLFDYGIAFFDQRLSHQHYIVNF